MAPDTHDHQVANQVVNPLQEVLHVYIKVLSSHLPALCQPHPLDEQERNSSKRPGARGDSGRKNLA